VKILAISDRVEDYLMTPAGIDSVRDVELILACGDLPYDYLEYLVTLVNVPLFYVHGNHDAPLLRESGQVVREPEGGKNLHGRVRAVRSSAGGTVLVAGLEGAHRCGDPRYQRTEAQMVAATLRLLPRLLWNRLRHGRAMDILITHAPPSGIHEGEDFCHKGFRSIRWLIRRFQPEIALHGHIDPAYGVDVRPARLGRTQVLNIHGREVLEVGRGED
jgi:Icc-related predicted phosphoesterase